MAISGKLLADFASFSAAVEKADVELRGMETGAGKVGASLNKMVDSFSGRKVISDATLMTEAVDRIGGASKLTATEMGHVNTKIGEAIAKFTALGQEAPVAMQKLHAETSKVSPALSGIPTSLGGIMTALGPLASAFGIAFSAGAVVNFGKSILADADALVKLSDKTGIAIEPLQGLKYAAEQSGNSFEQITTAISMMQKRIGNGDDSAVGALSALGISLANFKALSPDQQFTAIAREVATIEDPMERVRIATDIFGRSGAEILATLISKIDELTKKAPKMADGAARAWDDIGDAINRLTAGAKVGLGNFLNDAIDGFAGLARASSDLMNGDFNKIPASLAMYDGELAPLPPKLDATKRSMDGVGASAGEMDRITRELTASLKESTQKNEAFKRAQDALFGRDLIDRALGYVDALGGIQNASKLTEGKKKELQAAVEKALEAYKALGEQAPPELLKLVAATKPAALSMAELDAEVVKLHSKSLPPFAGLLGNLEKTFPTLAQVTAGLDAEMLKLDMRFHSTADGIRDPLIPAIDALPPKMDAATRAALSWSEAMAAVSAGLGSMGGSFSNPYALDPNSTDAEKAKRATELGGEIRYDDYGNQYVYVAGKNLPGSKTYTPRRLAGGGNVQAGESVWAGEHGPELFTPRSAGTISPHGAGGTVIQNVTVNTVMGNKDEIARTVISALEQHWRHKGVRFPATV